MSLDTLKVCCNGEVRRLRDVPTEFEELIKLFQDRFALPSNYSIVYKDEDGDLITITTSDELLEAIRVCEENGMKSLRVEVLTRAAKPEEPAEAKPAVEAAAAEAAPSPARSPSIKTVRVKNCPGKPLHMQQVQVFDVAGSNVATIGTASQSTTGWDGDASRTIDGDTNPDAKWPNAGHTQSGPNEFWQVELPAPTLVTRIVVFNRADCCQDRLEGACLQALDDLGRVLAEFPLSGDRCQTFCWLRSEQAAAAPRSPPDHSPSIKIVRVKNCPGKPLHMQQVQVFDVAGSNVATIGTASQSTTGWDGDASRTIDGDTNPDAKWPNAGHTQSGPNELWQVELPAPTLVTRIVVFNRADCYQERLEGACLQALDDLGRVLAEFTLSGDRSQTFCWLRCEQAAAAGGTGSANNSFDTSALHPVLAELLG